MIIDWPSDLVLDLARRRCVIVLGAGISCNSQTISGRRPKTWSDFLSSAITALRSSRQTKREITRLIKAQDFLTACQIIRNEMGLTAFHSFVTDEYLAPGYRAATIHDRISELDSRIVATPNFDTLYENRVNLLQDNTVAVKHYYDNDVAEIIRATTRIVLKLHGTVNLPNKMIFTRDDYTKARHDFSAFYSIFSALVVTQTLVFFGCGLNDPDVRLLLEDHAFRHEYSKPHFFVLPKGKLHNSLLPSFEKSLNVKILMYPCHQGDHTPLESAIAELRDAVTERRATISTDMNW